MTKAGRRLLAAAALAVVAGAVYVLVRPPQAVVQSAVAQRGPLVVALEAQGETRIHPRYVVAAPVAGRLTPIVLEVGDAVRRGDTVARLTPQPLDARDREQADAAIRAAEASRSEAAARVELARAEHGQAKATLERDERLGAAGQIAAEELDRARTAERTAGRALEAARYRAEAAACEVQSARAAILEAGRGATVSLCSPADGKVLRLFEESERVVAAGTPLLEIGDPATLEVALDVLSTDAVGLPARAPILLDAGGGRPYRATMRLVEPAAFTKVSPLGVEEQRVHVVGDLDESAPELGDRFRVEARIVVWEGRDVLQVPVGAVVRSGDGWALFTIEGGRARHVPVHVGHRNADAAEILDGVRAGDRVILYPGDLISDGRRVRPEAAPR